MIHELHFHHRKIGASEVSLVVKNPAAGAGDTRDCRFDPRVSKTPWARKWQPTAVLLPGKPHRQRILADQSPDGHQASDMTHDAWRMTQHAARSTQHAARSTQHAARMRWRTDVTKQSIQTRRSAPMQVKQWSPRCCCWCWCCWCPVVSDSSRPQYIKLPCHSPAPKVCPSSCHCTVMPSKHLILWWMPSSPSALSFPASGAFPVS